MFEAASKAVIWSRRNSKRAIFDAILFLRKGGESFFTVFALIL
jgi:hypothetical protein